MNEDFLERRVYNVARPTLIVYKPKKELQTDTAIIICPGGALAFLSIDQEGIELATYYARIGITAYILKYRLLPEELANIDDGFTEPFMANAKKMLPCAVSDLHQALTYVRKHAGESQLNHNKIGVIGFSAGGAVTMEAVYQATQQTKPDFVALVYPWMTVVNKQDPPDYKAPLFLVCSDDDPLELAPLTATLYIDWNTNQIPAEMHIYANGGHGYGIFKKNFLSDDWIARFEKWLTFHQFMDL